MSYPNQKHIEEETAHRHGEDSSPQAHQPQPSFPATHTHGLIEKAQQLPPNAGLPFQSQYLRPGHNVQVAPSALFTEQIPSAGNSSSESDVSRISQARTHQNFAERANALVNASMGCTPDGTSVVDPDSILDESGRLYHGYKDGKYLLPNDAVSGYLVGIHGIRLIGS